MNSTCCIYSIQKRKKTVKKLVTFPPIFSPDKIFNIDHDIVMIPKPDDADKNTFHDHAKEVKMELDVTDSNGSDDGCFKKYTYGPN